MVVKKSGGKKKVGVTKSVDKKSGSKTEGYKNVWVKKKWGKEQAWVKKNGGKKKTVYISTFLIPNVTMARWYSYIVSYSCTRVRIPLEVKVIYDLGVHVGTLG